MQSKTKLKQGLTCWFTGLSGSGKTTVSNAVAKKIKEKYPEIKLEILDGDEIRENLCKDLGFSKEDRLINIQRIAFLAGKISKHGILVLVPVIAPYKEARDKARSLSENFCEVFVKASIEEVTKRDVKGLYKKAIAGEIKNFTGISDPYEEPENPDLIINTEEEDLETSVEKVLNYLSTNGYLGL
jgi:adenylylsulfate kinase